MVWAGNHSKKGVIVATGPVRIRGSFQITIDFDSSLTDNIPILLKYYKITNVLDDNAKPFARVAESPRVSLRQPGCRNITYFGPGFFLIDNLLFYEILKT
jgi:hypothetical protein